MQGAFRQPRASNKDGTAERLRRGVWGYALLCAAALAACGVLFARQVSLSGAPDLSPLCTKINPNTAPAPSLVRLSGIGPARAQDIIAYRRPFEQRGETAFHSPRDLEAIKGIGPKTVEKIAPWLTFEEEKQ